MDDLHSKFNKIINKKLRDMRSQDKHGWHDGKFKKIRSIQTDNRGDVGELFIVHLLKSIGKKVKHTAATNPQLKQWDIVVETDDLTLEVKTASLGITTPSFQHENLEKDRNYDGLILLDIAPNNLYLTCLCKECIDWKNPHRRRSSTFYKMDLKLKDVQEREIKTLDDFERIYNEMKDCINSHKAKRKNARDI